MMIHFKDKLLLLHAFIYGCPLILFFSPTRGYAQSSVTSVTLQQAKEMAVTQNRLLKIARFKVDESKYGINSMRSRYYPNVSADGLYAYTTKTDLTLDQGSLGNLGGIELPPQSIQLYEGDHNIFGASVRAEQPITQLTKISTGVKVAQTDVSLAEVAVEKSEIEVKQGVEKLYYGILIAQKQKVQAEVDVQLAETQLYDVESALMAGKADSTYRYAAQAQLAGKRQKLLQTAYQIENYTADLKELLGLSPQTELKLTESDDLIPLLQPLQSYLTEAVAHSPEIRMADFTRQKASLGVTAAKKDYIPDLGVFAGYTYQNVINLLPDNNYHAGILLRWKILDFGTRKSMVNQRLSQQRQAEENLEYAREHVQNEIEKAYRNARQSTQLIQAASSAVSYRKEELRLKQNSKVAGLLLKKDVLETQSNLAQAEVDYFSALLNYRLALSSLEAIAGTLR